MSSATRTIFAKEFVSSFLSPTRYLSFAVYFAFSSAIFCSALQLAQGKFWTIQTLWTFAVALPLPVLISLLTMPLIAGERASGTYELMALLPIPLRKVVVGKFVATYLGAIMAIVGSFVPWFLLCHALKARAPLPSSLIAPVIMLLLHAFSWTALGTLASVIARRPWQAAVLTLAAGFSLMLVWAAASHFWFSGNWLSTSFPIVSELLDSAGGHIYLSSIVFHVSFGLLSLFSATQILEAQR